MTYAIPGRRLHGAVGSAVGLNGATELRLGGSEALRVTRTRKGPLVRRCRRGRRSGGSRSWRDATRRARRMPIRSGASLSPDLGNLISWYSGSAAVTSGGRLRGTNPQSGLVSSRQEHLRHRSSEGAESGCLEAWRRFGRGDAGGPYRRTRRLPRKGVIRDLGRRDPLARGNPRLPGISPARNSAGLGCPREGVRPECGSFAPARPAPRGRRQLPLSGRRPQGPRIATEWWCRASDCTACGGRPAVRRSVPTGLPDIRIWRRSGSGPAPNALTRGLRGSRRSDRACAGAWKARISSGHIAGGDVVEDDQQEEGNRGNRP